MKLLSDIWDAFTLQGFIDNVVYALVATMLIALFGYFLKRRRKVKKHDKPPLIELIVKDDDSIGLKSKKIEDRVSLLRHLIRAGKLNGHFVRLIPRKQKKLTEYQKKEIQLRIFEYERQVEQRIMILLMRSISNETDLIPNAIRVLERLLVRQDINVTGLTRIDIYRTANPEVSFAIYLTESEIEMVAQEQKVSVAQLELQLRIPTMTSVGVFPMELFLKYVVPGLVKEIYRLHVQNGFDLNTPYWEIIYGYEVGLG